MNGDVDSDPPFSYGRIWEYCIPMDQPAYRVHVSLIAWPVTVTPYNRSNLGSRSKPTSGRKQSGCRGGNAINLCRIYAWCWCAASLCSSKIFACKQAATWKLRIWDAALIPITTWHVMSLTILFVTWMLATARRTLWTHARYFRVEHCKRCISTLRVDPSVRELTLNLAQRHPMFSVSPTSISVLREPSEFYDLLLVSFSSKLNSKSDLTLSLLEHDSTCGETHLHIFTLYRFCPVRPRTPFHSFIRPFFTCR
jgi:hypothetical protein